MKTAGVSSFRTWSTPVISNLTPTLSSARNASRLLATQAAESYRPRLARQLAFKTMTESWQ